MRDSSSSSSSKPQARLFVAIELPAGVKRALGRWTLEAAGDLAGVRPVDPDSLHVTLCFLGWRPVEQIEVIAAVCAEAAACPRFVVSLAAPTWLPGRRPRVLAITLRDPESSLAGLQSRVARALEDGGLWEPERRPFLAHVTVARVRRQHSVRARPLSAPGSASFPVQAAVLMRSHPERLGARYERLASFPLGVDEFVARPDLPTRPQSELAQPDVESRPGSERATEAAPQSTSRAPGRSPRS